MNDQHQPNSPQTNEFSEETVDNPSVNEVGDNETSKKNQMEWDIDNLPNRLTMFRLVLVPLVVTALVFNLDFIQMNEETKSLLGWTAAWIFVAHLSRIFWMDT